MHPKSQTLLLLAYFNAMRKYFLNIREGYPNSKISIKDTKYTLIFKKTEKTQTKF